MTTAAFILSLVATAIAVTSLVLTLRADRRGVRTEPRRTPA